MPRLPPPRFSPSSRPEPSGPFKRYSLSITPSVSVPCPPPTLVLSFTVPIVPFHPSSVLQTSVDPGLLIPSAFYTPPPPLPSTNPHTTLYLAHTTPPTLTHWWFNTWGAQPHHPTIGRTCRQPSFPRWEWLPGVMFLTFLWPQSGWATPSWAVICTISPLFWAAFDGTFDQLQLIRAT